MRTLPENPKILVIRMSSLGDIILAAPVLRNLKARWPLSGVYLLVKPQFSAAASNSAFLSGKVEFKGLFKTARELNAAGFDLIIDLHANLRSRLLCAMVKAPLKIRYRKDSLARKLFVNFRTPSPVLEKHTLERYLETLSAVGVEVKYPGPLLGDWDLAGKTVNKEEHAAPASASPPALQAAGVAAPVKFCVFQSAFLGDCVLTLPLLKKLKELRPNASVTVLTRPETAGVFYTSGLCAEILTDNKKTESASGEFFRLVAELKKRKFDAALLPHRSLRTALLARAAAIPLRSGFSNSAGSFLLTHKAPFSWLLHDAERNLTLLTPFAGASQSSATPDQARATPDGQLQHARSRFAAGEQVHVGVNAGSAWDTKRWPKERWAALIKMLSSAYKSRVVLVGAAGEAAWNGEITRMAGEQHCLDLTGKTDVRELMEVISGLRLFVTNDSGPMHIAAALGVPVAAIFGPTTKELGFFPYGEKSEVIQAALKCRPCALHGSNECPRGHFLCMKLITPEKVFDAARRLTTAGTEVPPASNRRT